MTAVAEKETMRAERRGCPVRVSGRRARARGQRPDSTGFAMVKTESSKPIRAHRCDEGSSDLLSREATANKGLRRTLFGTSRVRRTREQRRLGRGQVLQSYI